MPPLLAAEDAPLDGHALHLLDGVRRLDPLGANLRAIEDRMAAPDAVLVADDAQALAGRVVAGVADEAVGLRERGGADVVLVRAEDGAGGVAEAALDAAGELLQVEHRLVGDDEFLLRGRLVGIVDDEGLDRLLLAPELAHVHDEVLDDGVVGHRLHRHRLALFDDLGDAGVAGEAFSIVDANAAGAADALAAAPPEGERAVLEVLDSNHGVEHRGGLDDVDFVGLVVRLGVTLRIEAEDTYLLPPQ